jgi:hypothetical protein
MLGWYTGKGNPLTVAALEKRPMKTLTRNLCSARLLTVAACVAVAALNALTGDPLMAGIFLGSAATSWCVMSDRV